MPTTESVQFVVGPRHRGSDIYSGWVRHEFQRLREYFHLAGLVVKWNRIDRMEVLGLDRFSVDFWLGSHPDLNPCDISGSHEQNLAYWKGLPGSPESTGNGENVTASKLEYGPAVPALANDFGSPFFVIGKVYQSVMADPQARLLEVTFLAGHLLRWYQLYGRPPHSSSPIWSWFPDSDFWQQAVSRHGKDAVTTVASQLIPAS
jgi:hypothetical protein